MSVTVLAPIRSLQCIGEALSSGENPIDYIPRSLHSGQTDECPVIRLRDYLLREPTPHYNSTATSAMLGTFRFSTSDRTSVADLSDHQQQFRPSTSWSAQNVPMTSKSLKSQRIRRPMNVSLIYILRSTGHILFWNNLETFRPMLVWAKYIVKRRSAI